MCSQARRAPAVLVERKASPCGSSKLRPSNTRDSGDPSGTSIWWFLWAFIFITYLFALFAVIGDLFRDHKLNGWAKAVWIIALIFVPFLTLLIYLVARG